MYTRQKIWLIITIFCFPFLHYEYQMDFTILMRCRQERIGLVALHHNSESPLVSILLHPRSFLQNPWHRWGSSPLLRWWCMTSRVHKCHYKNLLFSFSTSLCCVKEVETSEFQNMLTLRMHAWVSHMMNGQHTWRMNRTVGHKL